MTKKNRQEYKRTPFLQNFVNRNYILISQTSGFWLVLGLDFNPLSYALTLVKYSMVVSTKSLLLKKNIVEENDQIIQCKSSGNNIYHEDLFLNTLKIVFN